MKQLLLAFLTCIAFGQASAQFTVTGKVTDFNGEPLLGVNISEKGTIVGTVTDVDGTYSINVGSPDAVLIFTYMGYETTEVKIDGRNQIYIMLEEGISLGEVQIVGSRSYKRSSTDTPVAVDMIDIAEIGEINGKTEINQILQYAAPSFNATKQSGSDGADHIDPASLRGLGPDQTLVLINGKRRHQSSLINVFGTRGRGNTGTDLNALPAAAIERIEILRDGSSAQYGSDAIAGVMNIILKDQMVRFRRELICLDRLPSDELMIDDQGVETDIHRVGHLQGGIIRIRPHHRRLVGPRCAPYGHNSIESAHDRLNQVGHRQ